jgi:hypothetical protein
MRSVNSFFCKVAVAGLLSALISLSFAGVETQKGLDIHGFVQMQGGQFVNYKYRSTNYSHKWLQRNLLGFDLNATVNPRLNIYMTTGALVTFNTQSYKTITNPDDFANAPVAGLILDRAEMVIHCSPDPAEKLLDIGIGWWNEKYNRDARNLGEYLFRSGAYPGYIYQSGFDECFLNLAGIRLNSDLFGMWHNELMLTSEIQMAPFTDFSLAYLTEASFLQKAITIGGGIQLYRCFSADPDLTSPKEVWRNAAPQTAAPNYYLDSVADNGFGGALYDTSYYTFAGTKVMFRLAFDPKPLLGLDIFGKEDLKIYGEAAILGLKNYQNNSYSVDNSNTFGRPVSEFGYDTLLQKMPMMFGFNFPAFKVLDLLSLEFEYYGKKYVNAVAIPKGIGTGGYFPATVLPTQRLDGGYAEYDSLYKKSGAVNWKWSVYAKKTFFNNFTITAQAARDHILNTTRGFSMKEVDREEALVKKDQWYWMLKFSANF